jgi:aerobic C4-dicarboxylate transport protein
MSEGRAVVNFIGNSVATIVIAKMENAIDMPTYRAVVDQGKEAA